MVGLNNPYQQLGKPELSSRKIMMKMITEIAYVASAELSLSNYYSTRRQGRSLTITGEIWLGSLSSFGPLCSEHVLERQRLEVGFVELPRV